MSEFRNQVHYRMFFSHPISAALYFKATTITSLMRESLANQNNNFNNKQRDLIIKYLFRSFFADLCCRESISGCHVYYSCEKYCFYIPEAVVGMCCKIYFLEVNAKCNKTV